MSAAYLFDQTKRVDLERALEIIDAMGSTTEIGDEELRVVGGSHPELGNIYTLIPPSGNCLVLPIVIRAIDS